MTDLFGPSLGSIYAHLNDLEDDGLIRIEWGEVDFKGYRKMRYHAVTE
jgi:DNA-binding PadR family transcriptional regulator